MNITSQDYKHSSILQGAPNDRMFPKVRRASNGSPVALQSFWLIWSCREKYVSVLMY